MKKTKLLIRAVLIGAFIAIALVAWTHYWLPVKRNHDLAECSFLTTSALANISASPQGAGNNTDRTLYYDKFVDIFRACMVSKHYQLDEDGYAHQVLALDQIVDKVGVDKTSGSYAENRYDAIQLGTFWHWRYPDKEGEILMR